MEIEPRDPSKFAAATWRQLAWQVAALLRPDSSRAG
jgi:hypothetical protein